MYYPNVMSNQCNIEPERTSYQRIFFLQLNKETLINKHIKIDLKNNSKEIVDSVDTFNNICTIAYKRAGTAENDRKRPRKPEIPPICAE